METMDFKALLCYKKQIQMNLLKGLLQELT